MKAWFAAVAAFAAALTMLGYTAVHYRAQAANANHRLHTLVVADAKARLDHESRYQPVPELHSVEEYGAPFNVRVVCDVSGSSEGAGSKRTPLDLQAGVRPGDLYVKTCRGFALSEPSQPGPSS